MTANLKDRKANLHTCAHNLIGKGVVKVQEYAKLRLNRRNVSNVSKKKKGAIAAIYP